MLRVLDNIYTVRSSRNAALTHGDWGRLHELRLRGYLPAPDESAWAEARGLGLVVVERARVRLTPAGRESHAQWARAEPGSEAAAVADAAYAAFQPLNQRLLKVCHDWQIARGGIPNDHTDPAYDDRVIGRLHSVHSGAKRILAELTHAIPRFDRYETRFDDARAQLATGKREWFASPACDSYHTVWMQFHEDLLLATGRSRADEASA
jgi:hypothetical protein